MVMVDRCRRQQARIPQHRGTYQPITQQCWQAAARQLGLLGYLPGTGDKGILEKSTGKPATLLAIQHNKAIHGCTRTSGKWITGVGAQVEKYLR